MRNISQRRLYNTFSKEIDEARVIFTCQFEENAKLICDVLNADACGEIYRESEDENE